MRKMDDILNYLAETWKTLSFSQQTELAQTVAGTSKYNQLVTLINDWDFIQQNIEVARGSEDALQEQADIYLESWEAASKRFKASL